MSADFLQPAATPDLGDIRAHSCQRAPEGGAAADDPIREPLASVFASLGAHAASPDPAWNEARAAAAAADARRVREGELRPVFRAFVRGIAMGVVDDDATGYRYATDDEIRRWGTSADEIFGVAAAASPPVRPEMPGDGMLAVSTGDAFDAARILDRSVREQAAATLGEPFIAPFPKRDFLVMWRADHFPVLHHRFGAQVPADCASQSHPLACGTYRASVDGWIEPASPPAP